MDKFKVEIISKTYNPQQVIYAALHQDYSEGFVMDDKDQFPTEQKCGEIIVKRLLAGDRGHFGCLEHPSIVFNCGYFPHSVIQQARTHRIGVSFDVQSYRFCSGKVIAAAQDQVDIEEAFYVRPVGDYTNRKGKHYHYSQEQRQADIKWCVEAAHAYVYALEQGLSEEHARGLLPFDYRQHFVVSFNCRSLMHFLDLRFKKDAQLEIQQLCNLMWVHFQDWVPEIAHWYETNRLGKARLSP